jgi:ABC-type sugar transport system permease subunit
VRRTNYETRKIANAMTAVATLNASGSKNRRVKFQNVLEILPLAAPGLIVYTLFLVLPVGVALAYSLTNWTGINPDVHFVGLNNYVLALSDDVFQRAVFTSVAIAVVSTILLNAIGLPLAVLLNRHSLLARGQRVAFFVPIVLSPIVVGFAWKAILTENGIINSLVVSAGGSPIPFLSDPSFALASYIGVTVWQVLGYNTIIYLAALQTIPADLVEAARIDGAGGVASFIYITIPLLVPAILLNIVFNIVFGMREYDRVVAMTAGGPAGATTTTAFYLIQQAFGGGRFGYASALAAVMTIVIFGSSLLVIRLLGRRESDVE